ncbi:MAG: AI-2E family transporter [Patescibacteria group bacterium]
MKQTFDISWETIAKILTAVLGIWLLWLIRDVLALFFIIAVAVAALAPVVDRWSERIPRLLAVVLVYLIIIAILSIAGLLIVPPLVHEVSQLSLSFPDYFGKLGSAFGGLGSALGFSVEQLQTVASGLANITSRVYSGAVGVIGSIIGFFTIAVVTFYLLLEKRGLRNLIASYLPVKLRAKFTALLHEIGLKMGGWLRGQLLLALVVGIIQFIGFVIIGVPFALTLGVWAAFTEIIPYIGPVLGVIPALLVAFADAPIKALFVLILFVVVQQLEANFLVPKIMSKAVGLSPVVIIFAILVGARLGGIIGVIVAVPAAAAISVLVKEYERHLKG